MSEPKKFYASLYLYQEHGVMGLDDLTIVDTDPIRLARTYQENMVDGLLIFDMSADDNEHETALGLIQEICKTVDLDVYAGGNIHKMEDVKKLLYAGCKKVILDYEKPAEVAVTKEVSLKFGKEKIWASFLDYLVLEENESLLDSYLSGLVAMQVHGLREKAKQLSLPVVAQIRELPFNQLLEILSMEQIDGITGNIINQSLDQLAPLKTLCKENGILVQAIEPALLWDDFKKNSDGLVPVVVQDEKTQEVLMVAYMDKEAYENTIATGKMTYYSRSRQEQWLKGATSGHFQYVKSLTADCDKDTILAKVSQVGAACHTGAHSCFFEKIYEKESAGSHNPLTVLEDVFDVIKDRKVNPKEGSYTNYLFEKGIDKILKKLGEEATEIVIAAKNPNANEIKYEISDFLYHMMVLMAERDVTWEEIMEELSKR